MLCEAFSGSIVKATSWDLVEAVKVVEAARANSRLLHVEKGASNTAILFNPLNSNPIFQILKKTSNTQGLDSASASSRCCVQSETGKFVSLWKSAAFWLAGLDFEVASLKWSWWNRFVRLRRMGNIITTITISSPPISWKHVENHGRSFVLALSELLPTRFVWISVPNFTAGDHTHVIICTAEGTIQCEGGKAPTICG